MAGYTPPLRFDCAVELLVPVKTTLNGVLKKTYPKTGPVIMCSFRTFGGTETTVNGVYGIENTGTVDTWFNPNITADCRILLDGIPYDIINDPEDVNRRHQYMRFKVRRVGGVA